MLHFDISDAQGHQFLQQSFLLQKPVVQWSGTGSVTDLLQGAPMVRAGRKATLAESVTQKGRLPQRYLLPMDNAQVKCSLDRQPFDGGEHVSFTLLPDSADVFRAEMGLAFLLDDAIDRVQWIGQGPFASYPGRHQACRYGFWAKQLGDLYLEGNHGGVDAALFTDAAGNGLLVTGDSLDLNFEQTDRGLVLTVNAGVSGQGPKFRRTAFPIDSKTLSAAFTIYRVNAGQWPAALRRLFRQPSAVPSPFRPFLTQYDTYLNRFDDIFGKTEKEK
jgi:beta-galactosidase